MEPTSVRRGDRSRHRSQQPVAPTGPVEGRCRPDPAARPRPRRAAAARSAARRTAMARAAAGSSRTEPSPASDGQRIAVGRRPRSGPSADRSARRSGCPAPAGRSTCRPTTALADTDDRPHRLVRRADVAVVDHDHATAGQPGRVGHPTGGGGQHGITDRRRQVDPPVTATPALGRRVERAQHLRRVPPAANRPRPVRGRPRAVGRHPTGSDAAPRTSADPQPDELPHAPYVADDPRFGSARPGACGRRPSRSAVDHRAGVAGPCRVDSARSPRGD